jgi:phosphohistidine swiveling domain-containing protein
MGAPPQYIVPLTQAAGREESSIGGKAAKLARLAEAGVRVPDGFCVTSAAYERFVQEGDLVRVVEMELGRKPLDQMRWEEIWDAALRLRSAFLNTPIPADLAGDLRRALRQLGADRAVAVRSSAPGEDSAQRSFAGLHESYLNLVGEEAVLDAVRLVWASLWSDAALLYRRELSLDPVHSRMAVLVQAMIDQDRSGVAFGRDPRDPRQDRAIVEAVPGPCSDLVDGVVDPDRWILRRSSGEVLEWRPGEREERDPMTPLLIQEDLQALYRALTHVESFFGWPPDIEWTGRAGQLTLLQARPITTAETEGSDEKSWYLSLRPGMQRLQALRERVAGELIPELESLGRRLAAEAIEPYDDRRLAQSIQARWAAVQEWTKTYWDEFIPFAHGVRQLATYYNDAVRPADPYEFVGLLQGQQMLAAQRNRALNDLARRLVDNEPLHAAVRDVVCPDPACAGPASAGRRLVGRQWQQALSHLRAVPGGEAFVDALQTLQDSLLDVAYEEERLTERPDLLLRTIAEMARAWDSAQGHAFGPQGPSSEPPRAPDVAELERRLWDAVGAERRAEAEEVLAIARLSWRLRDDDNVLLGRIESQLLRAVRLGAERLLAAGRLHSADRVDSASAPIIAAALRDGSGGPVDLPPHTEPPAEEPSADGGESPRQLVGQPASPGMATGRARCVRTVEDLGRFEAGEVLVCDAIQPTMTHLVPLACAVVERRGGMLIHGAIIARELGIPCVNGIPRAVEVLHDGELLTVDGYLGIVTVGAPEFELEGVS